MAMTGKRVQLASDHREDRAFGFGTGAGGGGNSLAALQCCTLLMLGGILLDDIALLRFVKTWKPLVFKFL